MPVYIKVGRRVIPVEKFKRRRFLSAASVTVGFLAGCSSTETNNEVADTGDTSVTGNSTAIKTREATATETGEAAVTETETPEPSDQLHNHQRGDAEFSDETVTKAQELGKSVQKSVVKLTDGGTGGTGWIIGDGYILTNSHVVQDSETMDVETFDGTTGTASREGYHQDLIPDIALMSTDINTPTSLEMQSDADVSKDDPVLTVGHPGEVGDWVISLGRYAKYNPGINWELSDIPTSQGNSGSPILTLDGVVFGCISGTTTMSGGSGRVDRPDRVYTEFSAKEQFATATPSKTIEEWVAEWK